MKMKTIHRLLPMLGVLLIVAVPEPAAARVCPVCGIGEGDVPHTPERCRARAGGNSGTGGYSGSVGSGNSQAERQRQLQQWQQQRREQREESLRKIQRTYEGLIAGQKAVEEARRQRELDESEQEERELLEEAEATHGETPVPSAYQPFRPAASDLAVIPTPPPRPAPAQPLFRESLSSFLSSGASAPSASHGPSRVVAPSARAAADDTVVWMALTAMMADLITDVVLEAPPKPAPDLSAPAPPAGRHHVLANRGRVERALRGSTRRFTTSSNDDRPGEYRHHF